MNEATFYAVILPGKIGQEFDVPRSYGHARYRILGDHSAWQARDASKVYFRLLPGGGLEEVPPTGDRGVFCIAVQRLGGYDGPPRRTLASVFEQPE